MSFLGNHHKVRPLKNLAIFTTPKKTMDFLEVTGGFRIGEPPAQRELKKSPSSLDQ
jgi:hypothetical protein